MTYITENKLIPLNYIEVTSYISHIISKTENQFVFKECIFISNIYSCAVEYLLYMYKLKTFNIFLLIHIS